MKSGILPSKTPYFGLQCLLVNKGSGLNILQFLFHLRDLSPQPPILLEAPGKTAHRLSDRRVIHAAGQLAQFCQRVAAPSAPQPQCRVAPPITVALAELRPSLTFELLQGRQDLLPCHPGSQTLKGRLFARIGPNALAQLAGETLAAQYQAGHQAVPRPLDCPLAQRLFRVLPPRGPTLRFGFPTAQPIQWLRP